MNKSLLAAMVTLSIGAVEAPAFAQDGADAPSWTGFYVGGRAGQAWPAKHRGERLDFDTNLDGAYGDTVRTAAGANAFSPGFCGGQGLASVPSAGCATDNKGVTYYGMVGFDYQLPGLAGGKVVLGVVAEYGNANVNDSVTGFSTTPAYYSLTRSLRGAGSARGRIGYAMNRTLLYGTGGLAYGRIRTRFGTSNNANSFTDVDGDDARQNQIVKHRWGWTAGGGVEQRVARNFSIGAMYAYTRLRDKRDPIRVGRGTAPASNPFLLANASGTDLRRSDRNFARQDVTVTAAYRF